MYNAGGWLADMFFDLTLRECAQAQVASDRFKYQGMYVVSSIRWGKGRYRSIAMSLARRPALSFF